MQTVDEVVRTVEMLCGHALDREEGVQHGCCDRALTGATVCWMATPEAIRSAGEHGHELLVTHESLYFPYDVLNAPSPPRDWAEWLPNAQRTGLLNSYGLTLLRLHRSLDEICIFDTFAEVLGLGDPVFVEQLVKVYEIPECPLIDLIRSVQQRLNLATVRVNTPFDLEQTVHRVGLPWGGLGLFVNVQYQERLVEQHCDVFIAGESDNYGLRFAQECGIPMIETSHELSENPGLRRAVEILSDRISGVEFLFYENACAWRIL